MAWAIAGVAVLGAAALAGSMLLRRPEPARVDRFSIGPPDGTLTIEWPRMSPDGRLLAFLATDSAGARRIWVRPMNAFDGHPLAGGDDPGRPFWSPDGRFLAYFRDSRLRKVPVDGGPSVTVADGVGGADGSWGSRGVVVFDGTSGDSIRAVPANGGEVKPVTRLDRAAGETGHAWPSFLPDGRHFLFMALTTHGLRMKAGSLDSWNTVDLGPADGRVEYTRRGYIVFPREGTLLAQRFDPSALRTRGDPVPVGDKVTMGQTNGYFTVSGEGSLAYSTTTAEDRSRLVWTDRTGRELAEVGPPDAYQDIALSPDGQRALVCIFDARTSHQDVWLRNLVRGVSTRLTFGGDNCWPVWSPDGSRFAWASNRIGRYCTYLKPATGTGSEDSVQSIPSQEGPWDWSRDGAWLLTATSTPTTTWNILARRTAGDTKPVSFLTTRFSERDPRLSPDGRWVAYESNESGRMEVYAQPFPGPGGKWQISANGGTQPQWRADGRELFYLGGDRRVMAVPVTAGATFESGNPVALFRALWTDPPLTGPGWAVSGDGQRFLHTTPLAASGSSRFAVVTNWISELGKQ